MVVSAKVLYTELSTEMGNCLFANSMHLDVKPATHTKSWLHQ